MNVALWIVASLTSLAFIASGSSKLVLSRARLVAQGYDWVEDRSAVQVKLLGILEVAGGVALVLPPAMGVQAGLSPVAATGLFLFMMGAVTVHLRRGEPSRILVPIALGAVTALLAVLRFWPYQF